MPDLLASIDPGVTSLPRDRALLDKTVGFTDSLLRYRIFQRYGKCLLRTLVLFRFLRRQGWPVAINFGVRHVEVHEPDCVAPVKKQKVTIPSIKDDGQTEMIGHSWLTIDNNLFLESEHEEGYFTTFSFPSLKHFT
jgi:hypothetical protein